MAASSEEVVSFVVIGGDNFLVVAVVACSAFTVSYAELTIAARAAPCPA